MTICKCGFRFLFLFKTKKCGGEWFSGRLRYLYFWKEFDNIPIYLAKEKSIVDCLSQLVNDYKSKAQFEACELHVFSKV